MYMASDYSYLFTLKKFFFIFYLQYFNMKKRKSSEKRTKTEATEENKKKNRWKKIKEVINPHEKILVMSFKRRKSSFDLNHIFKFYSRFE